MNIQNPVPKPRTTGSGDHHEELQSYPSAYDDGKCNDNGGKHRRRDYTPSSYGPLPQRQGLATDTDINQGCFALQTGSRLILGQGGEAEIHAPGD